MIDIWKHAFCTILIRRPCWQDSEHPQTPNFVIKENAGITSEKEAKCLGDWEVKGTQCEPEWSCDSRWEGGTYWKTHWVARVSTSRDQGEGERDMGGEAQRWKWLLEVQQVQMDRALTAASTDSPLEPTFWRRVYFPPVKSLSRGLNKPYSRFWCIPKLGCEWYSERWG